MKIALLPVDARPVTRECPAEIAATAGVAVLLPPRERLGLGKAPASRDWVAGWLEQAAAPADALVVSLDMLAYGGLVPSRLSLEPAAAVQGRLDLLVRLRAAHPRKPIYGFIMTMRIPARDGDAEEPDYWARYGRRIWEWSYLTDQHEVEGRPGLARQRDRLHSQIPPEVLAEFLWRRERNQAVNRYALDLLEQGVLDLLVYPQDDTALYGINIREQRELRAEINRRRLALQALVYPGADEVASTLIARAVHRLRGTCPRVYAFYSGTRGPLIHARYEDRPLGETVKAQVYAAGGLLAGAPAEADYLLAVNVPGTEQGEATRAGDRRLVDTAGRNLPEFVERIRRYLSEGRPVAVADLAYANGADADLVELLAGVVPLPDLLTYGGWNTAGNSMGTVAAHAGLRRLAVGAGAPHRAAAGALEHAHVNCLFKRFADDYLYQTLVRPQVNEHYRWQFPPGPELEREVARRLAPVLQEWYNRGFRPPGRFGELAVHRIYLPWQRTFEVGLELDIPVVG